jgi:hypothetical protein
MPPKKIGIPSVTFGSDVIIDPLLSSMSSNDSCDETDENHTPNGVQSAMKLLSSNVPSEEIEDPKTLPPSLMRTFSSSVAPDAPKTPCGGPSLMRSLSSGVAPATPEAMNGVTFDEINTPRLE